MKKQKQKQIDSVLKKINHLTRHIRNVEDNCVLLGTKLIERGDVEFGHKLIANGMVHDASKFGGIEFENLSCDETAQEESAKLKLKMAIHHHNSTNSHHPEFWGRIQDMPRIAVAEMTADWKARSEEFGTSLRDWIDEQATKRYHFMKEERIYREIMEFVDLLCPKPFENLAQS